jgi:hypothetical protein
LPSVLLLLLLLLQDELLLAAATEFAIYNAQRHLLPARSPIRAVHAPARRIARTMVCLGRQVSGRSSASLVMAVRVCQPCLRGMEFWRRFAGI